MDKMASEPGKLGRKEAERIHFPYDETDRRIIALLQEDGRMPNSEIARRLGLAEATVRKRLNRLRSQGVIRVVAVPSPETVGLTQSAIISVACDIRLVDEVAVALETFPETRYLGYSAGAYDLIMECFFYSHEHLLDFIRHKVAPIPGVQKTDTSIILKVRKFSYEWELPETDLPDHPSVARRPAGGRGSRP